METIQTKKFMDNTLSFRQMLPLDRKTITALNLMILMMRGRSEKYPSRDAWTKALNHAYAAKIVTGLSGYGQNVLVDTRIKYLRPEYISNDNYMNEILDLSDQALNHPIFTEEILEEAKYLLKNRLLSARENPDALAVMEALQAAGPDKSIGIPVGGILEEVDSITIEQVQDLWNTLRKTPYQILSVGELSEQMEDFARNLPQSDDYALQMELLQAADDPVLRLRERDLSQSSLAQIYATGISPASKDSFALSVMNAVLGASGMSLLFEEVREKHSYCYSISGSLIRFDGAILILTGTRKHNIPDVKNLITKQIERLQTMDYPDEKLESARLELIDGLMSQNDLDAAMINQKYLNHLLHRELSTQELTQHIRAVTKEDVARIAKGLHLVSEAQVLETREAGEDEIESAAESLYADAGDEAGEGLE